MWMCRRDMDTMWISVNEIDPLIFPSGGKPCESKLSSYRKQGTPDNAWKCETETVSKAQNPSQEAPNNSKIVAAIMESPLIAQRWQCSRHAKFLWNPVQSFACGLASTCLMTNMRCQFQCSTVMERWSSKS